MNSRQEQIDELRRQLQGHSTHVSKGTENTQINIPQKLATFNNNYADYSDKFNELPAFCMQLPKEFKNAMISLKILHNTPYEFSLSMLLGMANTSCQHLYDVDSYKYGVRPISIYLMVLLGTGGSKSTIYSELKGPFSDFCKRMHEAFKNEDARFVSETKVYKKKIAQYEKDLESGLSPMFPDKPIPAETANYINSKFTVNGLIDTLISQPHASIVSAEAGVFFSSHAFQGGKQDGNRATEMTSSLTVLWDGDTLSRNIKEDRVVLENRRVGSLLLVQEAVIRETLNNKVFQEQGFTHRILISQIENFEKPDMSYDDEVIKQEELARSGLRPYLNRLERILSKRPKMMIDKHFELDPTVIESTHEAKVHMGNFYNNCKNLGEPGNKLERYNGFSQRIHEHTIRVAATLAAFNDNDQVVITINEAKAAVDIMNMFIDHRSNLEMGITDSRPDLSQGALVLETWFKKSQNRDKKYTKRYLTVYGPFRSISETQRITILQELVSSEVLVGYETVAKNGRKITEYGLNPG